MGFGAGTPPGSHSPRAQGRRTHGIVLPTRKAQRQAFTRTPSLGSGGVPVAVGELGCAPGCGETVLSFLSGWWTLAARVSAGVRTHLPNTFFSNVTHNVASGPFYVDS